MNAPLGWRRWRRTLVGMAGITRRRQGMRGPRVGLGRRRAGQSLSARPILQREGRLHGIVL
eukprot:5922525-Prymnesium_polylepis.1